MQIGAKASVNCSLGTNCIFIPGLCGNQGYNCGPALETGQSSKMLSPGTTDLEIVHPYNLFIQFFQVFCTSASCLL